MQANAHTIQFATFEDIKINNKSSFEQSIAIAQKFICDAPFGLEIDLDAIENMGSSAMSPIGFTIQETRNFTYQFAKQQNCKYIHLCEGVPHFELFPHQVSKTITYLISDIVNN